MDEFDHHHFSSRTRTGVEEGKAGELIRGLTYYWLKGADDSYAHILGQPLRRIHCCTGSGD